MTRTVQRTNTIFATVHSPDDSYAVFGKVVDGMAVVRDISAVATGTSGGMSDVPVSNVVIQSVTISTEGGNTYATMKVTF